MKKIGCIIIGMFILLVSVPLAVILYGKAKQDAYHTENIQEYGYYENHIAMEKEMLHSELLIFPAKELAEEYGERYIYDCKVLSFAGNQYFAYLECEYDEETLLAEKARLAQINHTDSDRENKVITYEMNNNATVYVLMTEENQSRKYGPREYAVTDQNKIIYVFSQYGDRLEKKYVEKEYLNAIKDLSE